MPRRRVRPTRVAVALALVAAIAAGCSSDDDGAVGATASDDTVGIPSVVAASDPSPTADGTDDANALTGAEICARLSIDSVAADLGLDMLNAEPDESDTPQCAYFYSNDAGTTANVTVTAMNPDDLAGATGTDAFDAAVRINEDLVGDDADRQDIDAGDNATRLTGPALHLGILQLGDQVYALVVPVADVTADDIAQMISTMATTLAQR